MDPNEGQEDSEKMDMPEHAKATGRVSSGSSLLGSTSQLSLQLCHITFLRLSLLNCKMDITLSALKVSFI